jgi:hypothetical protein
MRKLAGLLCTPLLAQAPFTWKDLGGRVELRENGKPVLVYNYAPQLREGAPGNRRRCCYIDPLYSAAGVSMLDDFPKDHWHHRGLFWAWPAVETGGKTYDFWMSLTAEPRTVARPSTHGANLEANNAWAADGKDIVRETLRLIALPARGAARELRVELTWDAIGAPMTLRGSREEGKSYGGFCVRFAERTKTVLRADGETLTKDEDRTPRKWAELEGVYGGKTLVLRITPDAGNPGTPNQWCLRDYGFVGVSFPGRTAIEDGYTLQPVKPLTMKFAVEVRDAQ